MLTKHQNKHKLKINNNKNKKRAEIFAKGPFSGNGLKFSWRVQTVYPDQGPDFTKSSSWSDLFSLWFSSCGHSGCPGGWTRPVHSGQHQTAPEELSHSLGSTYGAEVQSTSRRWNRVRALLKKKISSLQKLIHFLKIKSGGCYISL